MQIENHNFEPGLIKIKDKTASILAAGSMAVLMNLALWRFELRSITQLFWRSGILAAAVWFVLRAIIYRKFHGPISFDYKGLIISILTAAFLSYQLVPTQPQLFRYQLALGITFTMFLLLYLSLFVPLIKSEKNRLNTIFSISAFIFGLAGMVIQMINTLSVRMYGDDFCNAVKVHKLGLRRAIAWIYQSWSARFTSNILVMGLSERYLAPFFFLFLILFSLFLSLLSVMKNDPKKRWLSAIAGTFFIPFAIFTATPDLYKSLYWVSSTLTLLPLVVMIPIYLVVIARFLSADLHTSRWLLIVGFTLSFMITTTHEVVSLGWLVMHMIGLIWVYRTCNRKKNLRNYLIAGLIGASIGLVVLLISPGVDARVSSQDFPPPAPIPDAILLTAHDFIDFIHTLHQPFYPFHGDVRPSWLLIAAAAGLGWLTDFQFHRRFGTAVIILLTAVAMAAASFFPGAYATSSTIPTRTQFIPTMFLVFGVYIFGLFLPRWTDYVLNKASSGLFLLILIFGSLTSLNQFKLTIEPVRQFAEIWDARDKIVRTTSAPPQRIESVPWEKHEQGFDCVQSYYQITK